MPRLVLTLYRSMYIDKSLKNCLELKAENVVVYSDLHLGIGNNNDNSLHNQHLLFESLKYYNEEGFKVVLLGDTFELGENKDIQQIFGFHDDIMWMFSEIYKKGNLFIVRGNHDAYITENDFKKRFDHYTMKYIDFLPDIKIYDAIKLNEKHLLIHGHQYKWAYMSWFNKVINKLLRHGYQKLEFAFWKDPTSENVGKNNPSKVDQIYSDWGVKHNIFVIAGHTHSVCFRLPSYMNVGGGVLPRCLTCVEVQKGFTSSIKWSVQPDTNKFLKIERAVLKKIE